MVNVDGRTSQYAGRAAAMTPGERPMTVCPFAASSTHSWRSVLWSSSGIRIPSIHGLPTVARCQEPNSAVQTSMLTSVWDTVRA